MAVKIDLVAPQPPHGNPQDAADNLVQSSAMMVQRWLKNIGDKIIAGEPLIELVGNQAVFYVHAPGNGTLSTMNVIAGQNILSGHILGQVSIISKDEIDWNNIDQVTEILEGFLGTTQSFKSIKDTNEALGQLLGIDENPVFFNMSTEEKNHFLQSIIDEYQNNNLKPNEVARKLLEGMELRPPQYEPMAPQGPALGFGMRPPAPMGPGGMGGGMQRRPMPQGENYDPNYPSQPYPLQHDGPVSYPPHNQAAPSGYYDPAHYGQNPQFSGSGNPAIPQPHAYPSYPVTPVNPIGLPPQADQNTALEPKPISESEKDEDESENKD